MGYIGAGVTRFNTADELTVTGDAQIDGNTLVVDSTNNRVGIGTSSPARGLHVNNNGESFLRITSSDTDNAGIEFGDQSDGVQGSIFQNSTDNSLRFSGYNNTERMRIDSSGNVGIGTASPNSILHTRSTAPVLTVDSSAFASSGDGTGFGIYRSASGRVAGYTWTIENAIRAGGGGAGEYQTDDLLFKGRANTTDTTLTERMRIDSSGNVGIGTASPSELLHVQSSGDIKLKVETTNTTASSGHSGLSLNTGNGGYLLQNLTTVDSTHGVLRIYDTANSAERMRIDSSGNLLVAKTSAIINNVGMQVGSNGILYSTADGTGSGVFNRLTSDGEIVNFRKDGTGVGSIGSKNGQVTFGTGDTGFITDAGSDAIYPWNVDTNASRDNALNLGASAVRWKDLYLSGGVYLGGTGSANYLDDYEEGTWTPTSGVTLTVSYATYTKIGRLVFLTADIAFTTSSSGSTAQISGLPFTQQDTYATGSFNYHTQTSYPDATININGSTIYFRAVPSSGNLSYSQTSGVNFIFSVMYQTAS